MSTKNVKFISYDGKFPRLCQGNLILEIEGKLVKSVHLVSYGNCDLYNDYPNTRIIKGDWDIMTNEYDYNEMPTDEERELISKYHDEIIQVINDNISHGCCGGCLVNDILVNIDNMSLEDIVKLESSSKEMENDYNKLVDLINKEK